MSHVVSVIYLHSIQSSCLPLLYGDEPAIRPLERFFAVLNCFMQPTTPRSLPRLPPIEFFFAYSRSTPNKAGGLLSFQQLKVPTTKTEHSWLDSNQRSKPTRLTVPTLSPTVFTVLVYATGMCLSIPDCLITLADPCGSSPTVFLSLLMPSQENLSHQLQKMV